MTMRMIAARRVAGAMTTMIAGPAAAMMTDRAGTAIHADMPRPRGVAGKRAAVITTMIAEGDRDHAAAMTTTIGVAPAADATMTIAA